MDTYQITVLALGAGLAIVLLFFGVLSLTQTGHESVGRLRNFVKPEAAASSSGDQRVSRAMLGVDRWVGKRTFGASTARKLAQADIKLTVAEYLLLHVALFATGLILGPVLTRPSPIGVLLAFPLLALPQVYVASAHGKRMKMFNEQLPGALNGLSNSLRGGYGLLQGMKLVAEEMPTPISTEFQRVVSEVSYGLPYDVAFSNMLRRNTGPDVSLVITAIEINLEVGGNLSEILDNISSIIRDRVRIQGQVSALTAMTRFSSMVLTIMPFALAGIIFLVNKEYISQLWTTTGGLIMLVLAVVLVVIGSVLLQRVAKIDV